MSTVHTVSLRGLTGQVSTLTVTADDGPPEILLTGGNGRSQRELRDRVHAALANSGQPNRSRHIEVHLGPSEAAPQAAAVAVAALCVILGVRARRLAGTAVLGEVGLDGSLRPTCGVLPAVQAVRAHGLHRVIVPADALGQAVLVDGVEVLGARTLSEVADWLRGTDTALHRPGVPTGLVAETPQPPWRALTTPVLQAVEVAAAGGHHLLLDAVEGSGTLLVAQWLHQLLPDLTPDQQLQLAAIRSLTGPREDGAILTATAPMVTAHHSDSLATLVGGSVPGAVSRAHHGVLVACDLDRFAPLALETLRRALLDRQVRLAHGGHELRYPALGQLFATCVRTPGLRTLLAPVLLDTLDIRLRLASPRAVMLPPEDDRDRIGRVRAQARARVLRARARAATRWSQAASGSDTVFTNATVPEEVLHSRPLPAAVDAPIHHALRIGALSHRGAGAVLRMAWTAADLDGLTPPARRHIEQALALRRTTPTQSATVPEVR
ncbi:MULTISPECIES: ATP-binding protein [Actinosynnema]|uniref:ATP-binding protein n=1 Tax=Actinosynnema TaxID=40566 RepID=UPI0020A26CD6|nr:ATP-binding protein [Actinosynnema pretiosum]MCP2097461.1 magnesium chelatase family protein [Actinosynnema pretiosum]